MAARLLPGHHHCAPLPGQNQCTAVSGEDTVINFYEIDNNFYADQVNMQFQTVCASHGVRHDGRLN